jgi:hypothetical protein
MTLLNSFDHITPLRKGGKCALKLPCKNCITLAICFQNRTKFGVYHDVYYYSVRCSILNEYLKGEAPVPYAFNSNHLQYAVDFFMQLKYKREAVNNQ